jgi:hypothetical protein
MLWAENENLFDRFMFQQAGSFYSNRPGQLDFLLKNQTVFDGVKAEGDCRILKEKRPIN